MRTDIEVDGHSLDRLSQRLLLELAGAAEPHKTGELADAVDSTNQKVLYRMDTHLLPGDWVAECRQDRDARYFRLTDDGEAFVADRREAFEAPRTVDEACEVAEDARDEVEQLRDRVAAVERAVEAFDGRLEDLEDDVAEALAATDDADVDALRDRLEGLESDHAEIRSVTRDLYEDGRRTAALRTAGLGGRLRWLLTGELPEP